MGDSDTRTATPQESPAPGKGAGEIVPLAIILAAFFILAGCYLSRPGLAWDEALYVPYAEEYRLWFEGLPGTFNWNDFHNSLGRFMSHPPLAIYAMTAATQAFGNSMGRLYAARTASVFWMATLLAAVYFFTLRARGSLAASAACVFLMLMPQFFAYGILATLDMPMATWWFAAAVLFYAAMEHRALAPLAGLAAAFAFLTKINALALPLVLWPWGLYFHGRKAIPAIVWSAVLTPLVLFAAWPFLWTGTFTNAGKYFGEKFDCVVSLYASLGIDLKSAGDNAHMMLRRVDVPVWYFGRVYVTAPWHYPWIMTIVTTPLLTLACASFGAFYSGRFAVSARLSSFLTANVLFWLLAFSVAARPYDGVRLFLVIFPFAAILAGLGVEYAWICLSNAPGRRIAAAVGATLALLSLVYGFARCEPFGLSYYNNIVQGLRGAAERGLPVTYWGETADWEITSRIDAGAPEGAKLAAFPMEQLYVQNLRFFGLVRPDIRDVAVAQDWDYLIIANRGDALAGREDIRALTEEAVVTKTIEGVPAAWLVERKR